MRIWSIRPWLPGITFNDPDMIDPNTVQANQWLFNLLSEKHIHECWISYLSGYWMENLFVRRILEQKTIMSI